MAVLNPRSLEEKIVTRSLEGGGGQSVKEQKFKAKNFEGGVNLTPPPLSRLLGLDKLHFYSNKWKLKVNLKKKPS